jgi:uncharacterized protein
MLRFIPGKPALMAGRTLVLADTHIGMEHQLFSKGVRTHSPTPAMLKDILSLVEEHSPESLVILGDVKHNIPTMEAGERGEVREFLEILSERLPVRVTLGNHDGGLSGLLPGRGVSVSPAGGLVLGGSGFFHGHAWPSGDVLAQGTVMAAHQHPCVEFVDPVGGRSSLKCWCVGGFSRKILERYPDANLGARAVIVPAFNPLTHGSPLNRNPPEGVLGPMLKNELFKLKQSEIYSLEGTPLGRLSGLTQKESAFQEGFHGKQTRKRAASHMRRLRQKGQESQVRKIRQARRLQHGPEDE